MTFQHRVTEEEMNISIWKLNNVNTLTVWLSKLYLWYNHKLCDVIMLKMSMSQMLKINFLIPNFTMYRDKCIMWLLRLIQRHIHLTQKFSGLAYYHYSTCFFQLKSGTIWIYDCQTGVFYLKTLPMTSKIACAGTFRFSVRGCLKGIVYNEEAIYVDD